MENKPFLGRPIASPSFQGPDPLPQRFRYLIRLPYNAIDWIK